MAAINEKTLLAYSRLFKGLSDDELRDVASIMTRRDVSSGTVIIAEGDTGTETFLLEEGVVDIFRTLTIVTSRQEFGTRERSFVRLSGEDHCFFGEVALIGKGERSATVKAVTQCRLLVFTADEFARIAERKPRIGYVMMANIALILTEHLRKANDDVLKLTTALSLALSV